MEATKRPLFPIYDIMEHWQAHAYATPEVRPVHHALYYALVQMCKRRGGACRFNLHYQEGMQACSIASRNTYVAALRALEAWGFVAYTPGANAVRAAIVDVKFCASTTQALSIYRASAYASDCASTEHIIKEVKRLKDDDEKAPALIEELKAEIERLKAALPAKEKEKGNNAPPPPHPAALLTDPDDEQHWSLSPLSKPRPFRVICERNGFADIDFEHYRRQALAAAEDANISRTVGQWNSWCRKFLNNQSQHGPLLRAAAVDLSRPTPRESLPPPGTDCTGLTIVLPNRWNDTHNRMAATAQAKQYPNATFVHTR